MKKKAFDCVKMKREIQERILRETHGLSPAEKECRTEEMISADPVLRRVWEEARRVQTSGTHPDREEP